MYALAISRGILSVIAAGILAGVLCACSASPVAAPLECLLLEERSLSSERYVTDDFTIRLPAGSVLVEENTVDARYWTWRTEIGVVSVSWIGEIAREARVSSANGSVCLLHGSNIEFRVFRSDAKLVAISGPLLKNGAALLAEVEFAQDMDQVPVVLSFIRSIEIRNPIEVGVTMKSGVTIAPPVSTGPTKHLP